MALDMVAQVNSGVVSAVTAQEEEELYTQLLRLQDAIVHGRHSQFKLPPAAVEQLKASLSAAALPVEASESASSGSTLVNGVALNQHAVANNAQQCGMPSAPTCVGLPGLQTPKSHANVGASSTGVISSSGLNSIFLEKSETLVKAESQLKRQRIERDLHAQVEQRKHTRDKDPGVDAPSPIDIEAALIESAARVPHVSGLAKPASPASSSFDENDYYSSQVQSDWSSPSSASKGSDRAVGAVAGDLGRLEGPSASSPFATTAVAGKPDRNIMSQASKQQPNDFTVAHVGSFDGDAEADGDDEDDEYSPPDAAVLDAQSKLGANVNDVSAYILDDDENSEYEPGEITQESNVPTPSHQLQQSAQPSPQVPVIRNHLTHIAAPQPNRVSPLAVAKRSSIELELVNGRPEVVHKKRSQRHAVQSRASTASPFANGVAGSNKKRRNKKRKRETEPTGKNKRKQRERQNAQSPVSPVLREPYIKDEPLSPPPFANVPPAPAYVQGSAQYGPVELDLASPRHAPSMQYAHEPPRSGLRYEHAHPSSPAVVRVASPSVYRPVQRDTQDLRRVASMHYAQRPPSPTQRAYSPATHRTVSMPYGDRRYTAAPAEPESVHYQGRALRSPPPMQQYQDAYGEVSSPAMMPPPAPPPRRIILDQYGNQYYAEPAPEAPLASARASVAPLDRHGDANFERASSRLASSYGQAGSVSARPQSMAPPPMPLPRRQDDVPLQYMDGSNYRTRDLSSRAIEQPARYMDTTTSPVYQPAPSQRYEPMPPPVREQTSPLYAPPRSYSVRPEESVQPSLSYVRQGSIAPVQYVRTEAPPAPARAMSAMPGYEQQSSVQPRAYSHAPQAVKYVDQYGREVYPGDVRQVPADMYRYQ